MEHGKESTTSNDSLELTDLNSTPEVQTIPIIDGVHLGKTESNHFIDDVRTPVPDAGIGVRLWQNSIGATGIEATPLVDNTVETADINDSGELIWREQSDGRDGLEVSSVWGNVGELPLQELTHDEKIGNAGVQWGVVRVTTQDGSQSHFLVAAEFSGVVDDWNVRAEIAAISAPHSAEELQTLQIPRLPPA